MNRTATSSVEQAGGARVGVCADPADDPALIRAAEALAKDLALPLLPPDTRDCDLLLARTPAQLELRIVHSDDPALSHGKPVAIDLTHIDTTSGQGRSLRQPLVRAVGVRKGDPYRPAILDATAGFGEDAWLLASLGCTVTAVEHNPVMSALLRDALIRASATAPDVAGRLNVVCGNSGAVLDRLSEDALPDVVYMDPMFPAGRKTAERKPMRVLRWMVGHDTDSNTLLAAALRVARKRVVVKRPAKASPIAAGDILPVTTHKGSSVRYDVYTHAGMGSV